MAQSYTRQSTFADGDTISASLFNNEYNQLLNSFAYSSTSAVNTGHRHDGTAGQGGNIFKIGDLDFLNKIEVDGTNNRLGFYVEVSSAAVEQIRIQDGVIVPVTDNDIDLGTSSLQFKDLYINGTANLDSLVLGSGSTVTAILDEDDLSSDSATSLATQQSIKAYVDAQVTAQDFDFSADSGGALSIDLDSEAMTFTGGTGIDTSGSGNAVTFAIDSTVATLADTQTFTNKTLTSPDINGGTVDGATIATSDITVGAGKTLDVSAGTLTLADDQISGDKVEGGTIAATTITDLTFGSLNDGTITVTAFVDEDDMTSDSATLVPTQQSVKAYVDAQVTAQDLDVTTDSGTIAIDLDSENLTVTGGTGIDSSATGNAVTLAIDSTVATLTGSQTLTNKTLTTPVVSGNLTTDGLIDGRDVATDGTKLDGIEASADVTDTANVTAAGALMDSEVTNLAQVKAFDSSDYATAAQGTTADAALPRTGGAMTGAITTNSTFDGRDVATDGAKLDGIEASADVTDTANVTAAGALMDSELTSEASVKALDQGVATTDSPAFTNLTLNGTGSVKVPAGTTAQRDGSPAAGMFRYNSSLAQFEGYTDAWGAIGGGGTNTFTTDSFTGDGTTTDYALSQSVSSEDNLLVFIEGVFQQQDAYSIATAGGVTTLTFSSAPANGNSILIYSVAAGVSGSNLNIDSMTGDGSDVTLTLTINPVNENNTQVFIDGVYQSKSNYSISGTTLTFSTAPPNGSAVEVMTMTQTDINVPVDGTITPTKIASGDFYFDTDTLYVDATNNRVGIGTSSPATKLAVSGGYISQTDGTRTLYLGSDGTGGLFGTTTNHYLRFVTNNTERMRIDSGGSVLIGKSTPTDLHNTWNHLIIGEKGAIISENGAGGIDGITLADNAYIDSDTGGYAYQTTGAASLIRQTAGITQFANAASGSAGAALTPVERMRIDASGRVGIGVTAPNAYYSKDLVVAAVDEGGITLVSDPAHQAYLMFADGTSGSQAYRGYIGYDHNSDTMNVISNGIMRFFSGDPSTEAMRIDSSNRLMVNQTAASAASAGIKMQVATDLLTTGSSAGYFWENRSGMTIASTSGWGGWYSTGTASHFLFSDGLNRASIGRTSGTYTALSDVNKKKDFEDSTVGLAAIMQLQPKKFRMLDDADDAPKYLGFVAQDVESVIPEAYVENTSVDARGVENTFIGLTDRPFIAALVKAIQEQQATITALTARIEQLENN